MKKTTIIASEQSWIEGEAIRQLEKTAERPGMHYAVGLPDLHPGKGHPVGAVFASQGTLYPDLIGNDIGCGMHFSQTNLRKNKFKIERWTDRLTGLEAQISPTLLSTALMTRASEAAGSFPMNEFLGTLGSGNHFAELQGLNKIFDQERFKQLGLEKNRLALLIHSGSRGLGEAILRQYVDQYQATGVEENTPAANQYLVGHTQALAWAACNREAISQRFLSAFKTEGTTILDLPHNLLSQQTFAEQTFWLHRKGAVPADQGPVMIPGSRGSLSYLVEPQNIDQTALFSLAHGAGRKWQRSGAKARLRNRFKREDLCRTALGSHVICEDHELLYEEAPQAYKNIDRVIQDLQAAHLITVIATYQPMITYKRRLRPE